MRTIVNGPKTLRLGTQGENLAREFLFPETIAWAEKFGTGSAQMLCRPPDGSTLYPAALEMENGAALWRITASDLSSPGCGCCELRWCVGNHVLISHTYVTFVAKGLASGEDDPWETYLEKILQAGASALEAASRAENAAVHSPIIRDGSWWVWDPESGDYADTGSGVSGGSDGGTLDHRVLTFRDAENQHPISSITGLTEAVGRIPPPVQSITNVELEELLHE